MNTTDLDVARATLDVIGGWLLDMGDGHYLVTDDEGLVIDLRGEAFVAECTRRQVWDETRADTDA